MSKEKLEWISADKEIPEGKVLVVALVPRFGIETEEFFIGYYDNPRDYEDNQGKGWLSWHGSQPLKVTHWMKIPEFNPTTG